MEKLIKWLENVFGPLLRPVFNLLLRPYHAVKQFPQKSAAAVRKFLQTFLAKREKSLQDYVSIGRYYVSKRLFVFLVLGIGVIAYFIFIKPPAVLLKWLDRPVMLYTYEERTKTFTGKAELYEEKNRLLYKGELENGLPSGYGRLYDENGTLRYEGEFDKGLKNGQGIEYDEQGRLLYKGNFSDDQYNGMGTLYNPSTGNVIYEGEFQHGLKSGQGKEFYANGFIKYEGTWQNDYYNGDGKFFHETGVLLYSGGFLNGQFSGNGTEYYASGLPKYEGTFVRNLYHGQGTLYNEAGLVTYKGEFREGKFHGKGEQFYSNGNLNYAGEFQQDMYHGFGALYDENGQILAKGLFVYGTLEYGKFIGLPVQQIQEWLGEPPETAPLQYPDIESQLIADLTAATEKSSSPATKKAATMKILADSTDVLAQDSPKPNGANADEVKTDETKTDETKTDETNTDEIKTNENKTDETKTDEKNNGESNSNGNQTVAEEPAPSNESTETAETPPPYMLFKYPLEGMMFIIKMPENVDEYAVVERVILTSPQTINLVGQALEELSITRDEPSITEQVKSGKKTIYFDNEPYLYTISVDPKGRTIKRIEVERITSENSAGK